MGDLNSLSPQDAYDQSQLLKQMQDAGTKKFGTATLRFEVITSILKSGLVDVVKQAHPNFEFSVPTPYNRDAEHFTQLRLDYIFTSSDLVKNLKSARIIRTAVTDQLSDHYPVAAEFDW
jgi:exonuclease III